eukprot:g18370.t1
MIHTCEEAAKFVWASADRIDGIIWRRHAEIFRQIGKVVVKSYRYLLNLSFFCKVRKVEGVSIHAHVFSISLIYLWTLSTTVYSSFGMALSSALRSSQPVCYHGLATQVVPARASNDTAKAHRRGLGAVCALLLLAALLAAVLLASLLLGQTYVQELLVAGQGQSFEQQQQEQEANSVHETLQGTEYDLKRGEWNVVQSVAQHVTVRGKTRYITPQCTTRAGGPGTHYTFVKPSRKRGASQLLFAYFGGGGCFTPATCLYDARPLFEETLYTTYEDYAPYFANPPAIAEIRTGITSDDSPYRDYHMILVPYCTADVHVGHAQRFFINPQRNRTLRFYGFDNFLSSLALAQDLFPPNKIKRLLVGGLSAGGYGAALTHPYVLDAYPRAASLVLLDHSVPHILPSDQSFSAYLQMVNGFVNVPDWLGYANETAFSALDFLVAAARYYPKTRYAMTHPAFDEYLSAVYALAQKDPPPRVGVVVLSWIQRSVQCDWARTALTQLATLRAALPNLRTFEHAGSMHVLAFNNRVFSTAVGRTVAIDWLTTWLQPLDAPDNSRRSKSKSKAAGGVFSLSCHEEDPLQLDRCILQHMKVNMVRQQLGLSPIVSCNHDDSTDADLTQQQIDLFLEQVYDSQSIILPTPF